MNTEPDLPKPRPQAVVPPGAIERGAWAVRCAMGIVGLFACVAVLSLLFEFLVATDDSGEPLRHQPGAGVRQFGHGLRFVIGLILSWRLWQYLKAVRRFRESENADASEYFTALARWWYALALCLIALCVYMLWAPAAG